MPLSYHISGLRLIVIALFGACALSAQLTTGVVEGHAAANVRIKVSGGAGYRTVVVTDAQGRFTLILPYGRYRIAGADVFVAPLHTTRLLLPRGEISSRDTAWMDTTRGRTSPEPFSTQGVLLSRDPAAVTNPLDFTGISDDRLALVSDRAMTWTGSEFKLNGMDATGIYQPGRARILPDIEALEELGVRSGFSQTTSSAYGSEISSFLAEPAPAWHATLSTAGSGSIFSWSNLPPPAMRGIVQQPDHFRWFTRDSVQLGGPVTSWADIFASGAGQWSSKAEPLAPAGLATVSKDQGSRVLYGNLRGRVRAGTRDRFDGLYSGSRINLTNYGIPDGLEALASRRDSPSFVLPVGFNGQSETDHLDVLQAGWTRQLDESAGLGAIEVRYSFSTAHLDTDRSEPAVSFPQSKIELLDGAVTGAPPLENLAVESGQAIEGTWQPGWGRHHFIADVAWRTGASLDRITAPSDMNLITAAGAPAFVVDLNTPLDSRARVRTASGYVADHIEIGRGLSLDIAALADFSRGSLPSQSSGAGIVAAPRSFHARPDLIVWNSVSPRAGFAWRVPRAGGLVLRGAYFRLYAPLAARDLDFGNPNSLSGAEYQWIDRNGDGSFQPDERGALLMRFGGEYSSISPSLARPYADEIDAGAEFPLARTAVFSMHLYRRDDKNRIAAIDTGVPFSAFAPVIIFDAVGQQTMTVYAQNPATLGQDRYLLTNPQDLRFEDRGLVAAVRTSWRGFTFRASFAAERTYGPTNPGDAAIENDPGVVGALYMDPNTLIHASGRSYFDRGFVGKMQADYRLPFGIELAAVAVYLDGLVFARQVLVTGLPQGPIVVPATVRGSPEGGNRAEYVLNWNLRVQRQFRWRAVRFVAGADLLNVTNAGSRIQESDSSSPNFFERLPLAIQEPRALRLLFRWEF